jgi:hypothetical protein
VLSLERVGARGEKGVGLRRCAMHEARWDLPIGTSSVLATHSIVLFVKVLVGPLLMKSCGVDRAFLLLKVLLVVVGVHGGPVSRCHIS